MKIVDLPHSHTESSFDGFLYFDKLLVMQRTTTIALYYNCKLYMAILPPALLCMKLNNSKGFKNTSKDKDISELLSMLTS